MENIEGNNPEYEYAIKLNSLGFLPGPSICICGSKLFRIQNYKQNLINGICFRCINPVCRKRYKISNNSFFENHPNIKLQVCSEVIKLLNVFYVSKWRLTQLKNIS